MLLAALYIYDGASIEYWKCIHNKIMKQAEEFGHRGDCTKEPYTCAKCLLENMNDVVNEVYEYYRGQLPWR